MKLIGFKYSLVLFLSLLCSFLLIGCGYSTKKEYKTYEYKIEEDFNFIDIDLINSSLLFENSSENKMIITSVEEISYTVSNDKLTILDTEKKDLVIIKLFYDFEKEVSIKYYGFYNTLVIKNMNILNLMYNSSYGTLNLSSSTVLFSDINIRHSTGNDVNGNEMAEFNYKGDYAKYFNFLKNHTDKINIDVYKGAFKLDDTYFKVLNCFYSLGSLWIRLDGREGYTFNLEIPEQNRYFEYGPYVTPNEEGLLVYGDGRNQVHIKNIYNTNGIYKYFDLDRA